MNLTSILETILFVRGEPIALKKLCALTKKSEEDVRGALAILKEGYANRGLALLEKDGEYQLGSNPENAPWVEALMKDAFSEELSKSALETLAIVAYRGPLSRAQIEYIRGVNCSFVLRNLSMRGLVDRIENPRDARSYLYRVSFDFLKHIGKTSVEELPGFEEFKKHDAQNT